MLAQVLVHIRVEREERRGILTQGTGALAGETGRGFYIVKENEHK